MKKNTLKTGILIGILVIPVFFFLFLKIFGKNHFALPYLFPKVDETGNVILKNDKDTVFHQVPSFKLINQDNQPFDSEKLLAGKVYAVDFFFTRCGTICPKMTSEMRRVQQVFQENKDIQLVSISIDPKHDSASVLKKYAQKNDADATKWNFLTGDKKTIYDLAINGFKLPVSDASEYDKNIKSVDETFIHSEKLLLIDKQGYIRGIYDGTNPEDVDRLILEIKLLFDIYKKETK